MSDSLQYHTGLSALLDEDLSAFEYFQTLPKHIQERIKRSDISSFGEMQEYVGQALRENGK